MEISMGVRISNSKIMEISMGLEISMGVLISPQTGGVSQGVRKVYGAWLVIDAFLPSGNFIKARTPFHL